MKAENGVDSVSAFGERPSLFTDYPILCVGSVLGDVSVLNLSVLFESHFMSLRWRATQIGPNFKS